MPDSSDKPTGSHSAKCPICAKPSVALHRPFCSARCADVDLARWLREDYRLPAADKEESSLPQDTLDPEL